MCSFQTVTRTGGLGPVEDVALAGDPEADARDGPVTTDHAGGRRRAANRAEIDRPAVGQRPAGVGRIDAERADVAAARPDESLSPREANLGRFPVEIAVRRLRTPVRPGVLPDQTVNERRPERSARSPDAVDVPGRRPEVDELRLRGRRMQGEHEGDDRGDHARILWAVRSSRWRDP